MFNQSSTFLGVASFTALYLIAIIYVRHTSSQDPSSVFFDPRQAYVPSYSAVRRQQAEAFIEAAATNKTVLSNAESPKGKRLCVGVPSVPRAGASYLRTSIGSLLDGLSDKERNSIYLMVFIPQTQPSKHPAYSENWLHNLTDRVLFYDLPKEQMQHIEQIEREDVSFREKGLFDYTYLLEACYEEGSPYIAVFEDDVVAMDGWLHRTLGGLEQAEHQSALQKASWDFLYLRLFYTEEFFGWNSEEWRSYLLGSLAFTSVLATTIVIGRFSSRTMRKSLTNQTMVLIFTVYIPLVILLFFAAGRTRVLPLPRGVNEMERFGCCSQGLVFPREKAKALTAWFREKKIGFVDMLIEEYADRYGETRWALTPSVIQHIGRKSSKGDDYGPASKWQMSVAEKLWNFAFETNDAARLSKEHLDAIAQST